MNIMLKRATRADLGKSVLVSVFRLLKARRPRCTKMNTGLVLAANEENENDTISLISASNTFEMPAKPEGTLFVPFGEYPAQVKDRKTGKILPVIQVWNDAAAEEVISGLKGLRGLISRLFGSAPVYVGHPDVPEYRARDTDTRAYGRITAANIEEQDGKRGVGFRVVWNRLGDDLMQSGAYMFHSIHWPLKKIGAINGVVRTMPVGLRSIGLTNEPNIPGSIILAANIEWVNEPSSPAAPPPLRAKIVSALNIADDAQDDAILLAVNALLATEQRIEQVAAEKWTDAIAQRVEIAADAAACDRLIALANDATASAAAAANEALELQNKLATATNEALDLQNQLAAANARAGDLEKTALQLDAMLGGFVDLAIRAGLVHGGKRDETLTALNEKTTDEMQRILDSEPVVPLVSKTVALARRQPSGSEINEFMSAVNEYMETNPAASFLNAWATVKRLRPELVVSN